MNLTLTEFKKFSIDKHDLPSDSQRYGSAPYVVHLDGVDKVYEEYEYLIVSDEDKMNVRYAIWGHDLIEDTDVNVKIIVRLTNDVVADIVYRVTNERGYCRKEKNFKTYPKIWVSDLAIFVKLCDRIANTRNSKIYGQRSTIEEDVEKAVEMYKVYKEEYPIFRYALKVRGLYQEMWDELDKLYDYEG